MASFKTLWANHPARGNVCDTKTFGNQCAMRMGEALRAAGVKIPMKTLKTCVEYSSIYKGHAPGHIRSAQELANVFYRQPTLLGASVKCKVMTGTINDNIASFKNNNGMVFIMNGWSGGTDHIDVFNGTSLVLKGGSASYRGVGKQVWFWKMT